MPMIEGFGDEVTIAMMVILAVIIITACWLSTQLRFIPFVNVFILESMQDLVQTNVTQSDIVVPVAQEVPAEASSSSRDDAPQTSQTSDNTENVNNQAEAFKSDSETSLAEGAQQQEDREKLSSEEPQETSTRNANSSETLDSAEPSSEERNSGLTAENVAYLETQNLARKVDIKLIYMNNTHRIVQTRLTDTVGDFRRLHFEKELSENKTIRFIFHGKSLANDRCTLESCNVKRNSVIHCLVTPSLTARHQEETISNSSVQSANINAENGQDLSFELLLYPSIIIVFAVLWYLQFTYEQALLYPCIMSILGVSFFLLAMSLAIYHTVRIRAAHQAV